MLSTNAIDFYIKIKEELLRIQDTIKFIEKNNPMEEKQEILIEFLKSESSSNGIYQEYRIKKANSSDSEKLKSNYIDKYKEFKKGFDFMGFFGLTAVIKTNLEKIFQEYNFTEKNSLLLIDELYKLSSLYQNIIQNSETKKDIVLFFDFAHKCTAEYRFSLESIESFINSLSNNYKIIEEDGVKLLELQLLDIEYNVGEFADILKNLDSAYSNISRLSSNVKIANLKVVKVESGSLLSKILGDKNIIEVMSIAIKRVLDFVHYTWTKEGKLELNSKIMQDISNDADIIKKLEEMGINTKEAKQNISETLNATTKDLFEIVSKAPKVKLDDEIVVVAEPRKFIEYKKKYLDTTINENTDN
jgi:hypothetical protein